MKNKGQKKGTRNPTKALRKKKRRKAKKSKMMSGLNALIKQGGGVFKG